MSYRTTTTTSSYSFQPTFPSPSSLIAGDILLKGEPASGSRVRQVSQKASEQRPSRYNRTSGSSSSGLASPPTVDVIRYNSSNSASGNGERSNGIGRYTPEAGRRGEAALYDVDIQERSRSPNVRSTTTRKTTTTTTATTSGEQYNGWTEQRSSLRGSPRGDDFSDGSRRQSTANVNVNVVRVSPKPDVVSTSPFSDLQSPPTSLLPISMTSSPPSGSVTMNNGGSGHSVSGTRGVGKLTVFNGQEPISRQRKSPTSEVIDQREFFGTLTGSPG